MTSDCARMSIGALLFHGISFIFYTQSYSCSALLLFCSSNSIIMAKKAMTAMKKTMKAMKGGGAMTASAAFNATAEKCDEDFQCGCPLRSKRSSSATNDLSLKLKSRNALANESSVTWLRKLRKLDKSKFSAYWPPSAAQVEAHLRVVGLL